MTTSSRKKEKETVPTRRLSFTRPMTFRTNKLPKIYAYVVLNRYQTSDWKLLTNRQQVCLLGPRFWFSSLISEEFFGFNFILLFSSFRLTTLQVIKMSLYTSENPVFVSFSFYAALLGVKTLSMAFLTARQRFRKLVSQAVSNSNV